MEKQTFTQILKHISRTIHAPVRIISSDGLLVEYYGDEKEKDVILNDTAFKVTLLQLANETYPLIYHDFNTVYFSTIKHEDIVYITGPVNCDNTVEKIESFSISEEFQKEHGNISQGRVLFCNFERFCEANLLLFNILTGNEMSIQEMLENNYFSKGDTGYVKKELNEIYFRYQENEKAHNNYDHEVRELNSIREGDIEKLFKCMDEVVDGEFGTLSKEPLRSVKNLAIVAFTIFSRAAIDGGLQPEEAFSIADAYILQVDQATDLGYVLALVRQAKIEFATLVNELKTSKENNRMIEEAKRLISKNLHNRIVIREIAMKLGITPEYLSALFKKTEGMTVNDFIIKKKIVLGENLLVYSEYSIEDISYYLGFCSQSHFGKNFKRCKGMTPKQYRTKYGMNPFRSDTNKSL